MNRKRLVPAYIHLEFELRTVFVRRSLISSSMVVGSGSSTHIYHFLSDYQTCSDNCGEFLDYPIYFGLQWCAIVIVNCQSKFLIFPTIDFHVNPVMYSSFGLSLKQEEPRASCSISEHLCQKTCELDYKLVVT